MIVAGFDQRDFTMLKNLFVMTLKDRFLGSGLGLMWAVLSPLMMMGIFVFVFTFVFPGRLAGQEGALPFVIWLISGYGPWLALSEGLNSSTGSVAANAGIVKNIAFKSELLPMVGAMLGIVPLFVSFAILLVLKFIAGQIPGAAVLLLPFSILLMLTFVSGVGFFLSSLNVFVRDVSLALPNILMAFLFASPIFYPITAYPAVLQNVLQFNPFYVLAEFFRAPILNNELPPLWMFVYMMTLSGLLFIGGLRWFRRLKSFFDVRL